MDVKQIYQLVNNATSEVIGTSAILNEDLSNVVDIGKAIEDARGVDAYVKSLTNHIGKVIFVNRVYKGNAPSVLMDGWEFGSILEKVSGGLPNATENESWDLTDGQSYDPNIFYKPTVTAKFFNSKVTFEVPRSFTEMQVKQSFSSKTQLNGFISMLYNDVEKSMTVKLDALIKRTINSFIGETIHDDYGSDALSSKSGIKAVNLLYRYNNEFSPATNLTAANCLKSLEFLRFAAQEIGMYIDKLSTMSTLFNIGDQPRFTPEDYLHVIMLSEFANASKTYLQSGTFNKELVALPKHETVPYWQGTGTDYKFTNTSKINIKTPNGDTIETGGILCVMFDRDALGVCNMDRRVTSNYNAKAEFYNNYYKMDAGYFNDLNENFVVFFVA